MAGLRPNILCVIGAPDNNPPPTTLLQFIEIAYSHDIDPMEATTEMQVLYSPHTKA